MFEHILLDPEQTELLRVLVEASRNVTRENRQKFYVAQTTGGAFMMHPGLGEGDQQVYMGDIEILSGAGLLNLGYASGGTPNFDVTPLGFRYYEQLHSSDNEPIKTAEQAPQRYLEAAGFRGRYPVAYSKWREAERLLWTAESDTQLTTIGHHCREAMQGFATGLIAISKLSAVDQDPAHIVSRVRAVIESRRQALGDGVTEFLNALIVYWGTVSDLVQRQEHGAQKENQALLWIDARRVVFQTAVVMFEIDVTLSRHQS